VPSVGYMLMKAELLERPPDAICRLLQLLPVRLRRISFVGIYREEHGPVDGPDVDVGDLKSRYREPDLLRFEALLESLADSLGDRHEVRGQPGAEVDPVGNLFFGDDERVAGSERSDVQEGHARRIAPEEADRHLPLDNAREHRRKAPLLLSAPVWRGRYAGCWKSGVALVVRRLLADLALLEHYLHFRFAVRPNHGTEYYVRRCPNLRGPT
jgi:hypothetical protein